MTGLSSSISGSLLEIDSRRLDTLFGSFELTEFRNLATQRRCFALRRGEIQGELPLLARVHSSCVTSEFYGACDCDCAAQLDGALEAIAVEGRGVLFYLEQEGRGAGLAAKARDRMIVQASRQRLTTFEAYERMGLQPDMRRYDEVAAMTSLLGIEAPFVLLTNNPDKVASLEREKLRIDRIQSIEHAPSPFNAHYLAAKRRTGHVLADVSETLDAELPDSIEPVEPTPLPDRPELVRVARYLLPVRVHRGGSRAVPDNRAELPVWWRLHLYVDTRLGEELVVVSFDAGGGGHPLVHIQSESQLDRFPLRSAPDRESWFQVARAIAAHGAGIVACGRRPQPGAPDENRRQDGLVSLVRHHLAGRPAIVLGSADGCELAARLGERGVAVESVRELAQSE